METQAKSDKVENNLDKSILNDSLIGDASNEDESVETINLSSDDNLQLVVNGKSPPDPSRLNSTTETGDATAQPEVFAFVGKDHKHEVLNHVEPHIKRPHSPEKMDPEPAKRKCEDHDFMSMVSIDMNATGPLDGKKKKHYDPVFVDGVQLPDTVTKLDVPNGSVVYVVGTAHFSTESQEDVAKVIQLVQPHIVTVELCKSRISLLQLDEETILREAQNINFVKIRDTIRQNGLFNGIMYILLLSMSAHLTKELGMAPGGEFRRAMAEAGKVQNCCVHLGDRPINITLQRALAALSWWQTLKLSWHIIFSKDPISKEEVEKCKQRDLLEEMLAEMTGEFPALGQVFVTERDVFLAHSLALASQLVPTPAGLVPAKVVGVVGIGHVQGIVAQWGKVGEEDIIPIMHSTSQFNKSCDDVHNESISSRSSYLGSLQDSTGTKGLNISQTMEVNDGCQDPYGHEDVWLVYTSCNLPGPGCDPNIFNECITSGCSCEIECSSMCLCGNNYSQESILINYTAPIMECNDNCKCNHTSCNNKIIQNGPIFGLEIFKSTHKGLGLRTKNLIRKGKFICEYAGEIIGENEAKLRYKNQKNNYIIVVNEHFGGKLVTTRVDPSYIGNIGRYANHSCTPTAHIVPVRTNSLVPHLALFANDDLAPGTEITFDYAGGDKKSALSTTPCLCGSQNCRGYLPHDSTLA